MTDTPANLRYSSDHLWVQHGADEGIVRVGVTDFAQESLGDVVDVDLPQIGANVAAGTPCGDIESTKSVNNLISPVTGIVTAHNEEVVGDASVVNSDPYGKGWMFEARLDPSFALAELMDDEAYRKLVGA
jgi:glycine cleavage system H protein